MKSIRTSLWIRLTLVMGLLPALGAVILYTIVRAGLIGNVDDQLRLAAIGAREFLAQERKPVRLPRPERFAKRWTDFEREGSGLYFQAWDTRGDTVATSDSLAGLTLPLPSPATKTEQFLTLTLEDGQRVRALLFAVNSPKRPSSPIERARSVMVARGLEETERTLNLLFWGLLGCGGIVILSGWWMIGRGLQRSLQPLDTLGEQTTNIHTESLSTRFDESSLPTELLPIAQRLNDLMARLQQGFERERRFSADLAHEMRTPIAELRTVAETALRWPEQAGASDFEAILETSRRMQTLVEKLLTLARWESRSGEVEATEVSLPSLIQDCWQPFATLAARRGVRLNLSLPETLVWKTDPAMLRLIIENLLSNAAEYAPENSSVQLDADPDSLSISNLPGALTAEQLPKLFDRCWRLDDSRSGGSHFGLGLPLARASAEALGFELSASLHPEQLRFTLTRSASLD